MTMVISGSKPNASAPMIEPMLVHQSVNRNIPNTMGGYPDAASYIVPPIQLYTI